ncbi:MAG: hypothetical protein Q8O37_00765 [Sulfuricellaceae bacterium]|nr:hypothetical protein [Sulfuricellaceae bacterium]
MSAMFPKFTVAIAIGCSIALPAAAETPLILPKNSTELRQMVSEPAGSTCTQCGVVTSVRTGKETADPTSDANDDLAPAYMSDGPGNNVGTVPLVGRNAKEARQQMAPSSSAAYLITVRHDNGTYAVFEQQEKPDIRKGDRVKVKEGKVELFR